MGKHHELEKAKGRRRQDKPAWTIQHKLPADITGSLLDIATQIAADLNIVSLVWTQLHDIATRITCLDRADQATLAKTRTTRDLGTIAWNRSSLTDHVSAMVSPDSDTADRLLLGLTADVQEAVNALLELYDDTPAAAELILEGRLKSATQQRANRWLLEIALREMLSFHAFECAQLAAQDAYLRVWNFTGIKTLDENGTVPATSGKIKNAVCQQLQAAKTTFAIFVASPLKASEADTEWLEQLGITDLAKDYLEVLEGLHGANLQQHITRLVFEAKDLFAQIESQVACLEQKPGELRHHANLTFNDPALAKLWILCSQMSAVLDGEEYQAQTGNDAERLVQALIENESPWLRPFNPNKPLLKRKLHRALRVNIVKDPKAVPPKYSKLTARSRSGASCFGPSASFAQIHDAEMAHDSKKYEQFGSEYQTNASSLYNGAVADPKDVKNAVFLLEAQGRLWFRLRL